MNDTRIGQGKSLQQVMETVPAQTALLSENYVLTSKKTLGLGICTTQSFGSRKITPMQKPNRTLLPKSAIFKGGLQNCVPKRDVSRSFRAFFDQLAGQTEMNW
jgi:hypothetical protein